MRLAMKFVCVLLLGNAFLAAIFGYISVQRQISQFAQAARDEAEHLGHTMEASLADAWERSGHQGVLSVVRNASYDAEKLRVRWVWFDSRPGSPDGPSAPREQLTAVAIECHHTIEVVDPAGQPWLSIYYPVRLKAEHRGGLEFSRATNDLETAKQEIVLRSGLLIASMLLLSGLLATTLGIRFVGQPLRRLIDKTRRVGSGDLTGPLELRSRDELTELAESLNQMCRQLDESQVRIRKETAARIAAMEQLRHADRLKTVGRLAAGIAHELGTPLSVVSGRASLIASGKLPPEEINRSAAAIKVEAEKITGIIRQLLDFARCSPPRRAAIDLRQVAQQTVDMLSALSERRRLQLCFDGGSEPAISHVDSAQIQQVLTNLIVNAIQATPSEGAIHIAIARRTLRPPGDAAAEERTYLAIEVRDPGVGIPEENLQHLFEPFFTTKAVGEGTGLGLAIAFGIVQEHGGWIDVTSRPGEGSTFVVYLPEGAQA